MLREEPSLYQSPLSHQSVSSFGSPSPRPAAPTPNQVTPNTPQMGQQQQQPDGRNALLTSIAKGQFHLRKMSHSFEPKGAVFCLALPFSRFLSCTVPFAFANDHEMHSCGSASSLLYTSPVGRQQLWALESLSKLSAQRAVPADGELMPDADAAKRLRLCRDVSHCW